MTTIQRETIDQVFDEIKPLNEIHWEEIAHYRDIPLDPNYEVYRQMEKAGILWIFTAREAGRLVGYLIHFVKPALHYQGSIQANQDILFLIPEKRGTTVGARLIEQCDRILRDEGVQVVIQHVKVRHDFGPLLTALGYELVETIYARRLDHGTRR